MSCGNTHTPATQQQAGQTAQPPPLPPVGPDLRASQSAQPTPSSLPPSLLAPAILDWTRRNLSNAMGTVGEQLAAEVLKQELGYKAGISDGEHGVDVKASYGGSGPLRDINVEVKTTSDGSKKSFPSFLDSHADVGRQGSYAWHESRGEDPSAPVLGVLVNLENETVTILNRTDPEARSWSKIVDAAPFWLYEELEGDA